MVKRKRSQIYNQRRKRTRRNVQRGEVVRKAVLSNGVRGRISKNSAIHKRTYRGRRKPQSRGLRRAKRGNVGTKPSNIITTQQMAFKVLPNQKGVLGNIARKITIKDPFTTISNPINVELGGGYQVPDMVSNQHQCDKFKTYEKMTGDTTTEDVLTSHRMDWTMFTNDEWKDNLCYLLGLFNNANMFGTGGDTQPTVASPMGIAGEMTIPPDLAAYPNTIVNTPWATGANGTAMWGYAPPQSYFIQDTNGVTYNTYYGTPVPLIGTSNANPGTTSSNLNSDLNQIGWSNQQHYVLSESLTWYIHNQGSTDLTVILNECTLKYDIPLINGFMTNTSANDNTTLNYQSTYGGMLDPIELWRNSRTRQAFADKNNIELPNTKSSVDGRDYMQGYSPNKERLNNDIYDYASNTKYADRLNANYNVKKHFQTIRPGQTAHFKVKVDFNHKVSPHQITNLYAIGGKSKTFFFEFLTRPVMAGNQTNTMGNIPSVVTGRGLGRPPADVVIKWTKAKRFLLDQRVRTNTLNIRGARPKYNTFGIIEPDGDRRGIFTNDADDDEIDPEDINPDAVNELAGEMGGVFDINIGDVTIF